MNAPKTYLILLLSLTTIGGAVLSWRQYRELVELRAAAMDRNERADLQKRVWDLEKDNRALLDRLATLRAGSGDPLEEMVAVAAEERPSGEGRGRGGRDGGRDGRGRGSESQQAAALRELMNKPEVQAMLNAQQKSALEARYAALFKNLNLTPDQADKLTALLAERRTSTVDVFEAARAQGIDPRESPEAFRKLIADQRNEIDASIKSLLGDTGYAQLQNYEQTIPQRNLVNDLQQRLSYSNTPLTAQQAEQLVQILASNTPQRQNTSATANAPQTSDGGPSRGGPGVFGGPGFGPPGRGDIGGFIGLALGGGGPGGGFGDMGRGGSASVPITSGAVAQAQGVLSQPQLTALQQMQQQQQAQQQIRQLVNETLTASQPQRTSTKSGAASTPSGGPTRSPPPPRRGGG